MRRGLLLTTILFFSIGTFLWYNNNENIRPFFGDIHPFEAVPKNTALVLEFKNYFQTRTTLAKMPYAVEFEDAFFVKKLSQDLSSIRKIFSKTKEHRKLLLYNTLLAALLNSDAGNVDFLYIVHDKKRDFDIDEILKHYEHKKFNNSGHKIYRLELENNLELTIGYYQGLVLISKVSFLVERGLKEGKDYPSQFVSDEKFSILTNDENSKSDVNVFLLLENIPSFAYQYVNDDFQKNLTNFSKLISCAKFGLSFKNDGVEINGSANPKQFSLDNKFFINSFSLKGKNQNNNSTKCKDILPDDIAYFVKTELQSNSTLQLQKSSNISNYKKYFHPWIHKEWITGCAKIFTRRIRSEQFVIYKTHDIDVAKKSLDQFVENFGELNSHEYHTYSIRQVLVETLPIPMTHDDFSYIKNPWFTIINDYVIFSASEKSIHNWIDKYLTNQTLSQSNSFLELKNRLGINYEMNSYWNTSGTLPLIRSFFKKSMRTSINDQIESWGKMQPIGFRWELDDEVLTVDGFFNYKKEREERIATLWKTKLDSKIISSPTIHYNDQTEEFNILIQDSDYNLNALNSSGEIMWSTLVDDSIQSEIFAIDIFKDGQKKYIFNTDHQLFILTLDGRNVHQFPLILPVAATNGMSVVDLGEKEYAFFVACKDKGIYGYDVNGVPLSGWNPVENSEIVTMPLQHFQYRNQDYFVFFDKKGNISSWKKNGKKIMSGINVSVPFQKPLFDYVKKSEFILVANEFGDVQNVAVNGNDIVENEKLNDYQFTQFISADFAGSEQNDFAKLDRKILEVFYSKNNEFKSLGKNYFSNIQSSIFTVGEEEGNKSLIGTFDKQSSQIFLLNRRAEVHAAFPLAGTTEFEFVRLFANHKHAVVVGLDDEVVVYEFYK